MPRLVPSTVAIACMFAARAAHAYRPFEGTDADVAEIGEIELEIGSLLDEQTHGATAYEPSVIFNYGFAPLYEIVIEVDEFLPLGATADDSFMAAELLVKHVLREGCLQNGRGPSLALETAVLLPSMPIRGTDQAGWSVAIIASQRWSSISVHLNVKGILQRDRQLAAVASAIIEGPNKWDVRPVAELLVEREEDQGRTASALAGVIWRVSPDLAFDGAALVRRELGAATVEARVGLTWTFAMER
jgi:hypothetical protein